MESSLTLFSENDGTLLLNSVCCVLSLSSRYNLPNLSVNNCDSSEKSEAPLLTQCWHNSSLELKTAIAHFSAFAYFHFVVLTHLVNCYHSDFYFLVTQHFCCCQTTMTKTSAECIFIYFLILVSHFESILFKNWKLMARSCWFFTSHLLLTPQKKVGWD